MSEMRTFQQGDIDGFAKMPNDYSPLHCDSDYTHETMYGKPVVHGILGVLECVKKIDKQIQTLEVIFLKPMFCDIPYTVTENEIFDGNSRILKVKVKCLEEGCSYRLPSSWMLSGICHWVCRPRIWK